MCIVSWRSCASDPFFFEPQPVCTKRFSVFLKIVMRGAFEAQRQLVAGLERFEGFVPRAETIPNCAEFDGDLGLDLGR